jgi:ribonuclease T2
MVADPAAGQTWWDRLTRTPAQTTPCVLDKCLGRGGGSGPTPRSAPTPQAPSADSDTGHQGNFDFYVLALSWSSGFCESAGGNRPSKQCDLGSGLGFVVHGLWPQYEHGFPSDCAADRPVSQIALNEASGLFPDDGLARYEWRKHGTCSGKSPQAYFADVRRARASITIPPGLQHPQQDSTTTPHELVSAFASNNAGLRPEMMAVGCKQGVLQEVRICLSKDLRGFRACSEVSRDTCRASQIQIPRVR